ncbi:GNAT family N-acetyltransferase [Prauserella cavernicola]|uniref:GNAT family N-acetyltransferase n=1 Tax=Prauserella cavernicola TaxID=2800127 RepID=A0A934QRL7_9PSEU|nr:GNAT family N-acetyltransferase [Prauserella cavernicola]MBK1784878.1 GNAT family N-acetyltransferase [Prauserella cavernicola]
MHPSIRRAQATDEDTVLSVLTEAFANDPLTQWLFPDPAERTRLQQRFYHHQLGQPGAETYLVGEGEGVSLWHALPAPDAEPDGPNLDVAYGASAARLRTLGKALAPRHPGASHLYLFCMGVRGERQGAGLGSAMLRDRLTRADHDGVAVYLEASSPGSRALYLRHGFEHLGEPVRLADGPQLWPMLRDPRPVDLHGG